MFILYMRSIFKVNKIEGLILFISLSGIGRMKGGQRHQSLVTPTVGAIAAGNEVETERAGRGRKRRGEKE